MSTDWGIGCRTCFARLITTAGCPECRQPTSADVGLEGVGPASVREAYFSGEWDNARDTKGIQNLIDAAPEILAVVAKLGDQAAFSWSSNHFWDGGNSIAYDVHEFLRKHVGHRLSPMNEYGIFDGDCYLKQQPRCKTCDRYLECRLPEAHQGSCSTYPVACGHEDCLLNPEMAADCSGIPNTLAVRRCTWCEQPVADLSDMARSALRKENLTCAQCHSLGLPEP